MIASKRVAAAPMDKDKRFSTTGKKRIGIFADRFNDKLNLGQPTDGNLLFIQLAKK